MGYQIDQFGVTTLPPYMPEADVGTGGSRLILLDLPGGGVFDGLGSDIAPRARTVIGKRCTLFASSESDLETQYAALRALRGKRDSLWRRFSDGTLQWCTARLDSITATRNAGNIKHLRIELHFVMITPDWYAETASDLTYLDVGADDEDLATLHAESATTATLYGIGNDGNVDQPDVTLTITATFSAITALVLTNTTTGHTLTFAGTIVLSKSLVIDCGARSIENDGADAYANLTPPANKEEWMMLTPGVNVITIAVTGGPATVEIEFYDAWA